MYRSRLWYNNIPKRSKNTNIIRNRWAMQFCYSQKFKNINLHRIEIWKCNTMYAPHTPNGNVNEYVQRFCCATNIVFVNFHLFIFPCFFFSCYPPHAVVVLLSHYFHLCFVVLCLNCLIHMHTKFVIVFSKLWIFFFFRFVSLIFPVCLVIFTYVFHYFRFAFICDFFFFDLPIRNFPCQREARKRFLMCFPCIKE